MAKKNPPPVYGTTTAGPAKYRGNRNETDELEAIRYENSKLKKMNKVLIQRIEQGLGNTSGAYASFESAVILSEKVKERTIQLQQVLNNLERVNNDLNIAKQEAERKHQLLIDAIESFSDAFVMFDNQRQFTLANTAFYQLWSPSGIDFHPGLELEAIQQQVAHAGVIDPSIPVNEKIIRRGELPNQGIVKLKDGRWIQITERQTREGGLVIVFTDITTLKQSEAAHREQALAEKSRILQSTLDHLSQGVALFNANHRLEAWNPRFLNLTNIDTRLVTPGASFHALATHGDLGNISSPQHSNGTPNGDRQTLIEPGTTRADKVLKDGRLLEIERHDTSSGGFVVTYTDVTEREQYEAALRASEARTRLITDAMPALIGYLSPNLRYTYTNKTFEEWFQLSRDEIHRLSLKEILGAEEFERHRPYIMQTLGGHLVHFEVEQHLPCGKKYIHKTYIPDYDDLGNVIGLFTLEQDFTQQRNIAEALSQAYQHMEQRVIDRTRELTNLNSKLRQEVTERKEAEQQLVEAKQEAEHANLTKTKFLAAVSHDLLQPMSAARLYTSALMEQSLPPSAGKLVESINYSMEDVESLVSTLVDISKLDAGVVKPDITTFEVQGLLHNLANEFRQQARLADIEFHFVPCTATVATDSQLLARILRNLLSNALRYTDKGRILFGCRRRAEGMSIQVWDTGMGIPEEKLAEIFLEFKRLSSDKSRGPKGLGLGLAIVEKISRVLGSQINVRSQPGKGSVFSVLIPYGKTSDIRTTPLTPSLTELESPLADNSILVIDNDLSICAGMQTLLTGWGSTVVTATSIHDLQADTLKDNPPDMVIVDYHLDNEETGMDAASRLREWLGPKLPVLMITANRTQDLKQQVREQGYHLLHKPIKPHKLKSLLRHLLSPGSGMVSFPGLKKPLKWPDDSH